jgi:hypothetical protein
MSIEYNLKQAQRQIQGCIDLLNMIPGKAETAEIFEILQRLDDDYKCWCDGYDESWGDGAVGKTYEEGISLKYYIEVTTIHDLSKLLRKLKKTADERVF